MGIDINKITAKGINSNIILDVGIAVLNPISLAKIGFEAHRAFIVIIFIFFMNFYKI